MVCKKCEKVSSQFGIFAKAHRSKKTSTLAAPDPFQPSSSTRKIGENKLLSARARARPYTKPNQMTKGGKGSINPYNNKCLDCKVSGIFIKVPVQADQTANSTAEWSYEMSEV